MDIIEPFFIARFRECAVRDAGNGSRKIIASWRFLMVLGGLALRVSHALCFPLPVKFPYLESTACLP